MITAFFRFPAVALEESVKSIVSARNESSFSSMLRVASQVTPEGANTKTGNLGSIIAMGPCRKSAPENRSATT